MAMGKRKREEQGALWIAAGDLPQSGGLPFYVQVNKTSRFTKLPRALRLSGENDGPASIPLNMGHSPRYPRRC